MNKSKANRNHFLLKCNICKWHLDIDTACRNPNPCPQCGKYNGSNMVVGTKEELEKYLEDFNEQA